LTFLQNPSSHFERLSSPVFYRMVSLPLSSLLSLIGLVS
jgi:hypothetical protein